MADEDFSAQPAAKRRKISSSEDQIPLPLDTPFTDSSNTDHVSKKSGKSRRESIATNGTDPILLQANAKLAGRTVVPFLARHVPDQYAPMGGIEGSVRDRHDDLDTTFCYRHRPDLKCRRQADEPSMAELQDVSALRVPFPDAMTC